MLEELILNLEKQKERAKKLSSELKAYEALGA
jgi:hypothetical protein